MTRLGAKSWSSSSAGADWVPRGQPVAVCHACRRSCAIVRAHRAVNTRVFGSVRHGSDTGDSDLDILVDTTPNTTLFDLGAIRYKLSNLLGVPVDVLTSGALPDRFRQSVI